MKKVVCTVPPQRFEKYGVSFPEGWEVNFLHSPYTDEELIEACKSADYLMIGSAGDWVRSNVTAECSHLKLIQTEGVSFDKVDVNAAKAAGIPVCNNRAVNSAAVAEHIIGLMLAALRRTVLANNQIMQEGFLEAQNAHRAAGENELGGKQIGLIGLGAIGREVIKRLAAWGCTFCYYDVIRPSEEAEKALGVTYLPLNELLATSDVITMQVPVLESTYHMIGAKELALMKPTAVYINCARGEVVDSDALAEALEKGIIGAAAVDTTEPEPMPADHPFAKMSAAGKARLTITPHIAGTTDEAFKRMLQWSIANFERVENGEKPINCVNGLG